MISIVAAIIAACTAKPDPTEWATIVINSTSDSSHITYNQIDGKQRIKIIGTINESDFFVLRQNPVLHYLDLSEATVVGNIVVSYPGYNSQATEQIGNAIPAAAFGRAVIHLAQLDTTITFIAHPGLRSIILPKNITSIGKNAFQGCGISHPIELPQSLLRIYDSAFNNCAYLNGELILPPNLRHIGPYAFNQCGSLTGEVTIPTAIDSISPFAFANCIGLTKITLHDRIRKIGRSAFAGTTITQINFPAQLGDIDSGAFRNCRNLAGMLTLPSGLQTIGNHAFEYAGYNETLTIPPSVRSIGKYAFDSTKIKRIEMYWGATLEAMPAWDTSKHWFPVRFESYLNEDQYKIGVDAASLEFYQAYFSLGTKPFYNFQPRQ